MRAGDQVWNVKWKNTTKKNDAKHRVHLQSIEAAHFEKLGQLSHLSRLNARWETVIQHYNILQRRGREKKNQLKNFCSTMEPI